MNLTTALRWFSGAALDLLFPPRCAACHREGAFLCGTCLADLPRLEPPFCRVCAQPLSGGDLCHRCTLDPLGIDGILAPFLMEGPVREAVHRLKYNNLRALAPLLGALLADYVRKQGTHANLLVPVPLHPRRERERGYNQAALMAREAGKALKIPVETRALARVVPTPPQTQSASAEERRRNVRGAFRGRANMCQGQRVLLVDDACTTGATLEACALALREAGAASVWGVALARQAQGSHPLAIGQERR